MFLANKQSNFFMFHWVKIDEKEAFAVTPIS